MPLPELDVHVVYRRAFPIRVLVLLEQLLHVLIELLLLAEQSDLLFGQIVTSLIENPVYIGESQSLRVFAEIL